MRTKKKPQLARSATVDALPAACADERAAVEFLEEKRWGDCPCCPECGSVNVYKMTDRATGERSARFLWRCRDCNRQYTVRTGTVYAESLIPLHKWLRALWESASCKNGISSLELSRRLQISYKSALFLSHRIRHAMAPDGNEPKLSGTVEMDETYVGGKPRNRKPPKGQKRDSLPKSKRGRGTSKTPVAAIVQRGGHVRADVIQSVTADNLKRMLVENVEPGTTICTDEFSSYRRVCRGPGAHKYVRHSHGEYVSKSDPTVHTNTIEGFFSRLKRGLNGTYHAVSKAHLHRYVHEFAYRYNTRQLNDGERTIDLIRATNGKRLMYREPMERTG